MNNSPMTDPNPAEVASHEALRWYAVHTRSRHEKRAAIGLESCGVKTFLPLLRQEHKWSDRSKMIEVPIFSCYLFVQLPAGGKDRLTVLKTPGVLGFVGNHEGALPIPDEEIEGVRQVVESPASFAPYPFLKAGQRVRIRGGSLDGLEGVLAESNGDRKLVVSIELIQKSVQVSLQGYEVEVVPTMERRTAASGTAEPRVVVARGQETSPVHLGPWIY